MNYRSNIYHSVFVGLILGTGLFVLGCEGTVEPDLTEGEQIRRLLDSVGTDEIILFSSDLISDQTGTLAYNRTVDSVRRGFRNISFFDDTVETQGARLAFEALIEDTLFGTVSYTLPDRTLSFPYTRLAFGGVAKLLKLGPDWEIWRMEYRHAEQPGGDGSPAIASMTIASDSALESIDLVQKVRIFRDSVLTLTQGVLSDVDVVVTATRPNDSFFVTYPVAGGYETMAMAHTQADSLKHRATVQVQSTRRYELMAVQGFKSDVLKDTLAVGGPASVIRTAIMRFR